MMIGEFVFDAIKSKIFGSKDYFERVKSKLIRSLIAPLFVVVGAPTILIAVLSNVQYLEVNAWGGVIKFLGASSSEFLFLSASVLTTFLSSLGCNLYYALHNAKIIKELKEIEELEERQIAFDKLVTKFNTYIESREHDKAAKLGNFIAGRYESEVERNPDVIFKLLDLPNSAKLPLDFNLHSGVMIKNDSDKEEA